MIRPLGDAIDLVKKISATLATARRRDDRQDIELVLNRCARAVARAERTMDLGIVQAYPDLAPEEDAELADFAL